jgi:hypothetical protein
MPKPFTEAFVVTRFSNATIRFIHSSCGGDRVDGGSNGPIEIRLNRDVIAYRPTVVTVMLRMNDGGYRAFDTGLFKIYTAPLFDGGYNSVLTRYGAFVRELAVREGLLYADDPAGLVFTP